MTCLCPDYVLEVARKIKAERIAKGIVDTRVLVRRGRRVLALEIEEIGPDDEVLSDGDPYFRIRKKGRLRAFVEAWGVRSGDGVLPPGSEDLG
jgi:hypothetical protein